MKTADTHQPSVGEPSARPAAGHGGLSPHDAALRRGPRVLDPRPRGGAREPGQAALPGRPEGPPARRAHARGHLRGRRRRDRRPVPEAPQRPHQGDGRGRAPGPDHGLRAARLVSRGRRRGPAGQAGRSREPQGLHGQGARALRAVREALAPPGLRGPRGLAEDRRPRALRRHAVGAPGRRHRREADAARGRVSLRASPEAPGPAGGRDRQGQHRPPDQQQGQEADGEGPEGVLPQREDQGHPPGARPQGRPDRRGRGAQEEDRVLRHAEGGPREGRAGAAAPRGDAAGLGRGDRLAQLHRVARGRALEEGLARVQGPDARREDPERRPLRPREGQGADPRVPGRPPARPEDEGLDHLLRRASGRRQDLARQVDRPIAQPPVRAPVARRRARRGRDPRPPADLHRRVPRPDHPDDEEGRHRQPGLPARRSGQDVLGLPRRPGVGAARGARPGAEPLLRRPLPRRRVRPLEGHVHRHGQHRRPDPAGAEGPDGADPALRLHAEREGRDRAPVPGAQAARGQRPEGRPDRVRGRHDPRDHRELHARGRRAQPRARDRRRLPQGGPQDRPEEGRDARRRSRRRTSRSSSASPGSATAARAKSPRSASRRAWPGPRPAARS